MDKKTARIGDQISHGGSIVTGSPNREINNRKIARVSDSVSCVIHGMVSIVTGSSNTFSENLPVARIGDSCSCGAIIVSGSNDTFTNLE
jgi:uncharacterized Zn-binding protein involved in type VI secretion